jgi:acyl dehydratase
MPFDYDKIKNWDFPDIRQHLTERDTILYALGVGYGFEPVDPGQLRYVYERDLVAAPTLATVLAHPGFWINDPETGVDAARVLHGEQGLVLHAPLPVAGEVVGRSRVSAIADKGSDKGSIIYQEREVSDASGRLLATLQQTTFCRGDGGLSASDEAPPSPEPTPDEPPELTCDLPTIPQAALVYRLSGDYNPLHADPQAAHAGGFSRPILHGLATFGVAGHAILRALCDYEPAALRSLFARFSAPVFPGETIRTELWRRDGVVRFRARVLERDTLVLSHGRAELQ